MSSKLGRLFSLVELLVVVAILAVLISLLMPSLRGVMYSSKKINCSKNLKQITNGLFVYADDNYDFYPSQGLVPRLNQYVVGRLRGNDLGYHSSLPITPLMDPYFNGSIYPTFRCPLTAENWKNVNSGISYDLWFDNNARGAIRNEHEPQGSEIDRSRMMMRMGDSFTMTVDPGNKGRKFNVIAMDQCEHNFNGAWGTIGNHIPPEFSKVAKNRSWWVIRPFPIETNYAIDDGSVLPFKIFPTSSDVYRGRGQDNIVYFPKELASE
jgi:hypothetical protein